MSIRAMLMAAAGAGAASTGLTFVGGAAFANSASQTPSCSLTGLTGGIASSPSAGDLVIACIGFNNLTNRDITCSTSGYTENVDLANIGAATGAQMGVYIKTLSAADTSVAFNLGVSVASYFAVHVWRNVNATQPDVTTTTSTASTSGPIDSPAISGLSANSVVLSIGLATAATTFTAMTVPSGMENFFQASITGGAGEGIAIASAVAGSSSYNPAAFGGGASGQGRTVSATFAIRAV